jgi:hypothetical protein|tara:strand:+ start:1056 stop:1238 length:183 start_codon:yes stop_codon:yes gene_type:complete
MTDECEHEWEMGEPTDWSFYGLNMPHVVVSIYCTICGATSYTDGSWEFNPDDLEVDEECQ